MKSKEARLSLGVLPPWALLCPAPGLLLSPALLHALPEVGLAEGAGYCGQGKVWVLGGFLRVRGKRKLRQ